MFNIKINSKKLKDIISTVNALIIEGPLQIGPNGLLLKAIDPSQIAMLNLKVPKEMFINYECDETKTIGLNFKNLNKILSTASLNENVTLTNNDNMLNILFEGEKRKRNYNIHLLETEGLISKELNIDFDVVLEMEANDLKTSLNESSFISSYITFEIENKKLLINSKSEVGSLNIEIINDIETINKVKASYSLDYITNICKNANKNIKVYLKTDSPIKVEYNIDKAIVVYFLAPRKDDD
jgi:proliferating cell nuclear antigen